MPGVDGGVKAGLSSVGGGSLLPCWSRLKSEMSWSDRGWGAYNGEAWEGSSGIAPFTLAWSILTIVVLEHSGSCCHICPVSTI